jgi:L-arabinonolactonase
LPASIELVPDVRDALGESPLWDRDSGMLFRVDSLAPCIHRLSGPAGPARRWDLPSLIGSIGLGRSPGHLLCALKAGFHDLCLANDVLTRICDVAVPADCRLNDGKMDHDGRYVCGTLQMEDGAPPGSLFQLHGNGTCEVLESGVGIANATCFSPEGTTLYFADSHVGAVWAYPYDRPSGRVGARRVLADVRGLTGSSPDGATVDAEGFVWVALVHTGQLIRLAPDGRLDRTLDLPVPHPTCPAFGGPDLDILYVTSISRSVRMQSRHPEAGRLVAIGGLDVCGLPEARFGQP